MQSLFTFLFVCLSFTSTFAQMFYTTNFGTGGGALPSGWTSSDSRISANAASASSGYTNSANSPQASGGNNVIFQDCTASGNTITLDADGIIDCTGKNDIRVGMGIRRSSSGTFAVKLEYSTDGSTFNLVSSNINTSTNTNWGTIFFDLPSDANGASNLRFRFSFTTTMGGSCTNAPNFRIDDFSVGQLNSLPVELSGFNAQLSGKYVKLNWNTSSERNASHFIIEKSLDGKSFSAISQVQASGESSIQRDYSSTDYEPNNGINYYRLKQVDLDESYAYSKVISVSTAANNEFKSYWNGQELNIQLSEASSNETKVELLGITGQIIAVETLPYDVNNTTINTGNLPSSNYLLRITNGAYSSSKMIYKPN